MKKYLLLLSLIIVSFQASAQSIEKEEVDMIQSLFGMEKKAYVSEFISPEGEKAEIFWNLYDEYEVQRKELGQKRISLLEKYAANYQSLDDATTDEILKGTMSLQSQNDKLIAKYAQKIKKSVDVKTAAQFYQIEGYILSEVRASILESIPVIGMD